MPDVDFEKMKELAAEILALNGSYWFKFTCRACNLRQDVERENTIERRAVCRECGAEYSFVRHGGGLRGAFLVARRDQPQPEQDGF